MELTWVAIAASLLMGCGAALVFVFAVKRDYFHNLEDVKFQVFWSDLEEAHRPPAAAPQERGTQRTWPGRRGPLWRPLRASEGNKETENGSTSQGQGQPRGQ